MDEIQNCIVIEQKVKDQNQIKMVENYESLCKKAMVPKDWFIVLGVLDPLKKRPRRTSLHTLATVTGRDDCKALAKEMEESGLVVGYRCPDVRTLIFYRKDMISCPGMIDTRDAKVFTMIDAILTEYPFPANRGFRRFAARANLAYGMPDPFFDGEDYPYACAIREALLAWGYDAPFTMPKEKADNVPISVVNMTPPVNPIKISPLVLPIAPIITGSSPS